MLKGLTISKIVNIFALAALSAVWASPSRALEITSFAKEKDGEAEIVFCSNIKIVNVGFEQSSYGAAVLMPKEMGGYKNILMPSETLTKEVEKCFLGQCKKVKQCGGEVKLAVAKTRVTEGKQLLMDVSFDGELIITFFVTKYMRAGNTIMRVKEPQDFKITDKKYKAAVRDFIISKAASLI